MYYPRSFLKFILLGFLLVTVPLVYALGELILSIDRLESQGRQEVLQAAQAGRTSRLLYEQTTTLERIARQHLILDDAALLDEYARLRQDFRQTTRQLAALPLRPAQLAALEKLDDEESRLHQLLVDPQRDPALASQIATGYAKLVDGAQAMLAATDELTQRAIERLQQTAAEGREKWIYVGLATVAIALLLAIVFALLIARPIRQLDHAVRRMGRADFSHPIEVSGPQDLRYLGQRLEWLRARLAELEQQQTNFLHHVSHELKTPLTAVREGIELLRDDVGGPLTPEQHDIVRIVRDNTLSLQKLIEDLLAWHQTRAMEPATLGPVVLSEVMERVIREQKLAALARTVTFDCELKPLAVVGDREKLRTILDNLVSNAIKYSPRGATVKVGIRSDAGHAVLEVSDEGPGVAPSERERIFESFYQGQARAEGRIKGSGLGLAIAREYAQAQNGRIEVTGRDDGRDGALFRLTLPLSGREATPARERLAALVASAK
ncbi:MAG TPA: ATP-binding protein [Casimicrobiaceae bacterium]